MKKIESIKTPIGLISIDRNEISERYHCIEKPQIQHISEIHIRVLTIDQAISWGEEVFSPRLHQNYIISTGD